MYSSEFVLPIEVEERSVFLGVTVVEEEACVLSDGRLLLMAATGFASGGCRLDVWLRVRFRFLGARRSGGEGDTDRMHPILEQVQAGGEGVFVVNDDMVRRHLLSLEALTDFELEREKDVRVVETRRLRR